MPKAAMRERPDVLKAECGAQQVLELIANKWTALVIYSLGQGPMRHSALRRRIGGISQKMLTQTLRNLERNGLVTRRIYPVVPPRVEYSLTSLGQTLCEPLKALCRLSGRPLTRPPAPRPRNGREMASPAF